MSAVHLGFYNTATTRTHVRFQFSTHAAAGGNVAPNSAFEAADLRIYKAADGAAFSATQRSSANGITMTSPFDSLTGFHDVDIDLTDNTDAGFYAAGGFYSVVLAPDETVDGQTLTGVVLAFFEIGVAKADVTQFGGTAGTFASGRPEVNTSHIAGSAVSTSAAQIGVNVVNLGGSAVDATSGLINANVKQISTDATAADNLEAALDGTGGVTISAAVTGNITGNLSGSVGSVTGNVGGNVAGSVASVTAGVTLAASAVQAIWDALTSALTTVGSIGKLLVDNINATLSSRSSHSAADVWAAGTRTLTAATNITSTGGTTVPQTGDSYARLGAPAGASVSADIAAIEAQTDDIGVAGAGLTDLGGMSTTMKAQVESEVDDALGSGTGAALTAVPWNAAWDAEVQSEVQDALDGTIADSVPADGTRPSISQALYMITQFLMEKSVSSTTVTVKKVDGSTSLLTLTLDSATDPTSITRAS